MCALAAVGIALSLFGRPSLGLLRSVLKAGGTEDGQYGSAMTSALTPYFAENDYNVRVEDLGQRRWSIVDVHEHLGDRIDALRLLAAMNKFGIARTCLMASTIYTLTLNPVYGFEHFKENNDRIIAIKREWPRRFAAFVTIDPAEPGSLKLLQGYVRRGADGLKLYLGHGGNVGTGEPFHVMALDDPRMESIWAWTEQTQLPIVLHVNLNLFWDEILRVLGTHPYLRLNIPHLGLQKNSEERLKRLSFLLDRYPNVYSDVSFGFSTFQVEGFESLAASRARSRQFFIKHRRKLLFGTDMVIEESKDDAYVHNTIRSYMQFLEADRWRFFLMAGYTMHGLGLDDETLAWIYEKAPAAWLLLNRQGILPDRTDGWPINGVAVPSRPVLSPLAHGSLPSGPSGEAGTLRSKAS
jgi:hypothetical protein